MRDLAIPDGSDALANLRSKTPEEIVDVLHRDSTVNFLAGGTIDGWVLTETKGRRDLVTAVKDLTTQIHRGPQATKSVFGFFFRRTGPSAWLWQPPF